MNAQQAENLRILIRHMEGLKRPGLNMDTYFEPCGTPACALGEACTVPALVDAGIVTWRFGDRVMVSGHRDAFGFTEGKHTMRLFGSATTNAWKRADVTPQEWAIEARKVLAENGYSMDEKPADDHFKPFMDRLRKLGDEPVLTVQREPAP